MISGKCCSASSSHQVTWAMTSFTDQSPATPGSVSREPDKPAYDPWNAVHAVSNRFRSCCLFTAHDPNVNPSLDARRLTLSRSSRESPTATMPLALSPSLITALCHAREPCYQWKWPNVFSARQPDGPAQTPGARVVVDPPGVAPTFERATRRRLSQVPTPAPRSRQNHRRPLPSSARPPDRPGIAA